MFFRASVWLGPFCRPCPVRKERVAEHAELKESPGVAEPWCVCNNKTTETYTCVDGSGVPGLGSHRVGILPLGAVTFLPLKFHQEQRGEKP